MSAEATRKTAVGNVMVEEDANVFFFQAEDGIRSRSRHSCEPLFRSFFDSSEISESFIASMTQKLTLSDISDESKNYLDKAGITTACLRIKSKWTAGGDRKSVV